MRQIDSDNALVARAHDVIFKLRLLMVWSCLDITSDLRSGVGERFVELTETVLGFDDVEVLPVSLSEREGLGRAGPEPPVSLLADWLLPSLLWLQETMFS